MCVWHDARQSAKKTKGAPKTTFQRNICGSKTPGDERSKGGRIMKSISDCMNGISSSRRSQQGSHCRYWACRWRENGITRRRAPK